MKISLAIALVLSVLSCQPGAPEDLDSKKLQSPSLEAQATLLKMEAAKVDQSIKMYGLHAEEYNQSTLHKSLRGKANHNGLKPKGRTNATSQNSNRDRIPSRLAETHQLETMQQLHAEYERHVDMLRGVVDQYRNLYKAYAEHCDDYRAELQRYRLEIQQADLAAQTPELKLSTTKQVAQLAASEQTLKTVIQKLGILEERSPTLPESYLCPAYDDLRQQFVQALDGMIVAVKALPNEDKGVALKGEQAQIKALQQEMEDAEHLHDEQKSLQAQFATLQETFADINSKHGDLLNLSKKLSDI